LNAEQIQRAPAIVVLDDEPEWLERLQRLLARRYAADYQIVTAGSAADGLRTLRRLRDDKTEVALILADQWMPEMTGADLLAAATDLHPQAMRAVLLTWGELEPAREAIVRAAALGHIETFIPKPVRDADESFYHAIAKFLDEWDRENRPQPETLQLVGERWDPYSLALRDALQRSGVPFGFYETDSARGRELLQRAGASEPQPVAVLFDGRALARPTAVEIAAALGVNTDPASQTFDLAVIGSGPAGLAAAVYAASEGLAVLVVENVALGGQASTSSMIRNYLGFPRGLSGADLAARAYRQAWFFGAGFLIGRRAAELRVEGSQRLVVLDDGSQVRSRAVILAIGVSYRRLRIERLEALVGRGAFYGAPVAEARGMTEQRVVVVGGGNSSAQMALYVARFAAHVTLVTRGSALNEMSDYLVREIRARRNIDVRLNTVLADARGERRLEALVLRDKQRNELEELATSAVFILIGAEPHTGWLPAELDRDERGYIVTGEDGRAAYETSLPGVFAVGDVRLGSMKRVAAAVGEGSSAVRMVHDHLAREDAAAELATRR
jgi:thioredoxin reductase (NADPH)